MRDIEKGSSQGVFDDVSIEEAERFFNSKSKGDALEFCFDCFIRLLQIGQQLKTELDIEPSIMTLTDKDIRSATYTDEYGNVVQLEKDPKTGKLQEI